MTDVIIECLSIILKIVNILFTIKTISLLRCIVPNLVLLSCTAAEDQTIIWNNCVAKMVHESKDLSIVLVHGNDRLCSTCGNGNVS